MGNIKPLCYLRSHFLQSAFRRSGTSVGVRLADSYGEALGKKIFGVIWFSKEGISQLSKFEKELSKLKEFCCKTNAREQNQQQGAPGGIGFHGFDRN